MSHLLARSRTSARWTPARITSYNVCYTKLLRNWEIVYPELLHHKHKGHDTDHKSHKGAAIGTFPALSDEDAKKLEEGLLKLSKTANSLADVSNATLATKQFTDNITMASQSVEGLGKASKAGEEIISQSSTRFATGFNDANKGFTEAVTAAQNELSKTYKLLSSYNFV